jgi:hypothetical protein
MKAKPVVLITATLQFAALLLHAADAPLSGVSQITLCPAGNSVQGALYSSPAPLDGEAFLREIELQVDAKQYEKVLTEMQDAKLQQALQASFASTDDPSTFEQLKRKALSDEARLIVLEKTAKMLRADISQIIGENNLAADLQEHLEHLQGIWKGVEVGRESEGQCTLKVTGKSIHFQGASRDEWYSARILPGRDPKEIFVEIEDSPRPDDIHKAVAAIFKIVDEKLTLVGHPPGVVEPPKSFKGDSTSRAFVFQKVQPQN